MSFLVGEPFLAGWGGDTLRLYRKTGDQFVQLSSATAIKHPDAKWYPRPSFLGDRVVYSHDMAVSTAFLNYTLLNSPYLTGTRNSYSAGSGGDSSRRFFVNPSQTSAARYSSTFDRDVMSFLQERTTIDTGSGTISSAGVLRFSELTQADTSVSLTSDSVNGAPVPDGNHTRLAYSPDGRYLIRAFAGNLAVYATDDPPTPAFGSLIGNTTIASSSDRRICWSSDSTWAFCVNWVDNRFIGVFVDGSTATKLHDEVMEDQVVSVTSFGPFVAVGVSYEDAGTQYRTHIYKKSAGEFFRFITLDGIGADVLFTPDGTLLLDATTRKAFNRSGSSFTEAVGMMTNVAAGTVISNVSWHVPASFAQSFFYDGVASDILMNTIDQNSLKILLVDPTYNFNKADTLISTVTNDGAREVFGANWPEGGVPLTTVTRAAVTGGMKITADDIEEFIFGGVIQARSAVIYSGTRPLIFVDFLSDIEINNGESLIFNMDDGFVVAGE